MRPRVRSCAACRKKRIKCDATYPTCLMCSRFGRRCPGIDDGPIMIDMTSTARDGMQRRQQKSSNAADEHAGRPLPNTVHVSIRGFVTEAFFARFLTYWTSEGDGKDIRNKRSWLHRLPCLSTDGKNQALELALQATATSYCAVDLQDDGMSRHAWYLYGQAVRKHSQHLTNTRAGRSELTIHMISTSVLFSFFEAMQSTNADAYRSHIYGAAKMFEVTDPRQCHEGVLCQIFYHIQTQMVFTQLTSTAPKTAADVSKILRDALSYEELPIFQRLTTHVSRLASIYNRIDPMGVCLPVDGLHLVEYMVERSSIDALWHELSRNASYQGEELFWYDANDGTTVYRDAFTALTTAYFGAARILLSAVAPHFTASYLDMNNYYSNILDAASYLQISRSGFAYMRMAMPLLMVALHSPAGNQRTLAIGYIQGWTGRSMRGVSALALDTIQRRRRAEE